MIDVLQLSDVLDAEACAQLCADLRQAGGAPATVSGHGAEVSIRPLVRNASRAAAPARTRERIAHLLHRHKDAIEAHFGLRLGDCEDPQFLRYRTGDFFVAHQDGNTPLIFDDTRFRRISVVIFLSRHAEHPAPGTYGGGAFVLHGPYPDFERMTLAPAPGTLIAFRSETTHEVAPVTHGERFTIVSWYPAA